MITVTLQQIKKANPCSIGWKKVLKANDADMNKPFPLISILDSNNLDDLLWVISNVPELSEYDEVWREFACWCALQNVEKIKEYCSDEDYNLIVTWLETNDLSLRELTRSVTKSIVKTSAGTAAEFIVRSVSESTAESATESILRCAVYSASGSTLVRFTQANKLRELLSEQDQILTHTQKSHLLIKGIGVL